MKEYFDFKSEKWTTTVKWSLRIGFILGIVLGLWIILNGVRFSPNEALSAAETLKGRDVEIVLYQSAHYGEAVIFEDKEGSTFGVAQLNRYFGILWVYGGGASGYEVKENQPFKAVGAFTNNKKGKDQFVVGIKINNENIKYIAVGKGPQIDSNLDSRYSLNYQEVKEMKDVYRVEEVENGFALMVFDEYSEENWTITAFDDNGNLVADKLSGAEPRNLR